MKLYEGGDKEQKLTQYLVELGYNYKVLIPVNRLDNGKKGIPEAYLLTRPLSLVQKFECPFVARYVFLMSNAETQLFSDGLERNSLLNGLRRIYPIEYIYKDQIKQQNMYDLTNNLGLTHLIEEKHLGKFCWVKVAIFVYLYYQNDFEEYINWLQRVPIYIDIYIFTDMEEKQKLLLQKAKRLRHKIVIQLVSARGREWGIFLNEVHEISGHYKYACFLHDKSYHSFEFPIQAISFRNMLWENLLPSADGIMDIISFFEKNKHIGLILPPIVKCGTYFKYFMNFWTVNYENTLELAKRIGIDMNYLRLDKPPISIGGMFWYKVEALNNLYKIKLDHDKFPEEPMGNDGTINHALERILPYVAQDAGYYSAFAIKKEYICLEWMVEMQIIQAMGKRSKSNMNSLYDFECELPVEIIPNM
jgi:rhamnosyltransferase